MVETTRKRRYMYNILLARPLETIRKRVQARKQISLFVFRIAKEEEEEHR